MAKSTKKKVTPGTAKSIKKKAAPDATKVPRKRVGKTKKTRPREVPPPVSSDAVVIDRLYTVVESRRNGDPTISHSARLLSRGPAKVAQKFGEEAVECVIEAVAGNRDALIGESADVLYHLLVLWVSSGVKPAEVWTELIRREGISGIAEKAARPKPMAMGTSKIP